MGKLRLGAAIKRFKMLWLVPVLFAIALSCWAVSSPVGASPDDDFHLASAWCGIGERAGLCEADPDLEVRVVPAEVAVAAHCYAFNSERSAACQTENVANDEDGMARTDRGNFASQYPGLYYAVMSVFASPNVELSTVVMRLANIVIFLGLTCCTFVLLPRQRRTTLTWAWLASMVPLGIFVVTSNNPSSWTIISAGTLWIALLGYFETSGRRRIGLGAVAVAAAVLGLGSRPDAVVYAVIGVVVAVVLAWRWSREFLLAALLPLGIVLAAIVTFLSGNPAAVASAGLGPAAQEPVANPIGLLLANFLNVPTLWAGAFGSWNLGWLDTALPGVVAVGCLFCFAGVTFSGLRHVDLRKILAVGLVGAALWAMPTYVLFQNRALVGAEVQPRYLLPLIIVLAGVAISRTATRSFGLAPVQTGFVFIVLAGANAVSLYFNIRRYVTGTDVVSVNLDAGVEWWWSAGFSPMVTWILGTLSFAIALILLSPALKARQYEELACARN